MAYHQSELLTINPFYKFLYVMVWMIALCFSTYIAVNVDPAAYVIAFVSALNFILAAFQKK